jgi:tetratricopeptide (TPR) repeat protein
MPAEPAAGQCLARGESPEFRPVRGRPLAEAVADYRRCPSSLGLYELLRRFVAACDEIAYGHSRGITHLHLTPRLILLGEFGETSVVGWSQAPGANGQAAEPDVYAAAFLAPEQAGGPGEGVGPATDVYALGAVLFALLTGAPPYTGATAGDVLGRVREGLAWQPRMVASRVPAALEAVCLTAMERKPTDRYASAAELAREVECWMAGEPVHTNYVEPKGARLARWARTRAGLIALTGLAVLGVVAALSAWATVAYVTRAERNSHDGDPRGTPEQPEAATVDGGNRQHVPAGDELAAGIQVLQVMALKARPRSDDGPTLAAYKADLLRTALDVARQLAHRADRAAGSGLAAAQDRIRLAELFELLGQSAEARRQYERAMGVARPAARTHPDSPMAQRELLLAARGLGQVCLREGQPNLARNLGHEAHAAAEAWARIEPNSQAARHDALTCLALVAEACILLHELPTAREVCDRMIATAEGYGDEKSGPGRLDLADALTLRGKVEQLDYHFGEALRFYDQALAVVQPLEQGSTLRGQLKKASEYCRAVVRAVDKIDTALAEPPDQALPLLVGRAAALARAGRPDAAAATVEKMRALKPEDGVNLYNVACCYALCVSAVGAGNEPDALPAEDRAARADYAARAIKELRAASDHGFRDVEKMESDPDLDALRRDPGYRALVGELKAVRAWLTFPVLL